MLWKMPEKGNIILGTSLLNTLLTLYYKQFLLQKLTIMFV